MEVAADDASELRHAGDEPRHLAGHADPDRVAEEQHVRLGSGYFGGERDNATFVDLALERAAEGHADRDGAPEAVLARAPDDPSRGFERFLH